jgi:hypothetical protein
MSPIRLFLESANANEFNLDYSHASTDQNTARHTKREVGAALARSSRTSICAALACSSD